MAFLFAITLVYNGYIRVNDLFMTFPRVLNVLELPGCYSQAKNMDELFLRTKEAIKCQLLKSKINSYL
jgi:hypothetical protein